MNCFSKKDKIFPLELNECCICQEIKNKPVKCTNDKCNYGYICSECLINFRKYNNALKCPLCNVATDSFVLDIKEEVEENEEIQNNFVRPKLFCINNINFSVIFTYTLIFLVASLLCFMTGILFCMIVNINFTKINPIIWFFIGFLINFFLILGYFIFRLLLQILINKILQNYQE